MLCAESGNKNISATSPMKKVCVIRYLSTAIRNSDIPTSMQKSRASIASRNYRVTELFIKQGKMYHACRQAEFSITILCFTALVPIKALNATLHTPGVATRIHTQ